MLTELVNSLFDEIKRRHNLASDAALARHLSQVTGDTVSDMAILRWRRGEYPKGLEVIGPQILEYADSLRVTAA